MNTRTIPARPRPLRAAARARLRDPEPVVTLTADQLQAVVNALERATGAAEAAEAAVSRVLARLDVTAAEEPAEPQGELVGSATVARVIGRSAQWVREHGLMLGGGQPSPGAPWAFDLERAKAAMGCYTSSQPHAPGDGPIPSAGAKPGGSSTRSPSVHRRRVPNGLPPAGSILTSRPRKVAL